MVMASNIEAQNRIFLKHSRRQRYEIGDTLQVSISATSLYLNVGNEL
jgi:hypothetical protein